MGRVNSISPTPILPPILPRRVRRAPQVSYDGPGTAADGLRTSDNFDMYNGAPDRYDWKLEGKKEIYIPYNSYKLDGPNLKYADIVKAGHINQDLTRYELHRVWHVVATLKPEWIHQRSTSLGGVVSVLEAPVAAPQPPAIGSLSAAAKRAAVAAILADGASFGRGARGAGRQVIVEFVSANPTGPLHVGHGRQGALGDALSALLDADGWAVIR